MLARAQGRDVALTMVDGAVVFDDGGLTRVDIAEVNLAAARSALAARRPSDPARVGLAGDLVARLDDHYRSKAQPTPPRF